MLFNSPLEKEQKKAPSFIVIDLKKVKITKETALPAPTPIKKKKAKEALQKEETRKVVLPPKKPKLTPKKPPQKKVEKPIPSSKEAVKIVQKNIPAPKIKPRKIIQKELEKRAEIQKKKEQKQTELELSSLLASVEEIKTSVQKDKKEQAEFQENIKALSSPLIEQEIGISEKEKIALMLRECWNLDAGVQDIENMRIEILVFLDKQGNVLQAKINDTARYSSDKTFKSVAESAERAVYICNKKGEDSPFKILAQKYGATYSQWRKILFTFNPMDGGVF
ncbi:MAG: hypothetical protein PHI50_05875 [Alphaproteobacteria bacterium]|nr:hypothetical protein [Alphaproteobacteria bacterium]